MRIIIAGGTGFVGSHFTEKLVERGFNVTLLIKPGSESKIRRAGEINAIFSDPCNSLGHLHIEADILVNAAGIIREFPSKDITFQKVHVRMTENLIEFAHQNNIPKIIQISALGVGSQGTTGYHRSKFAAEEAVKSSGLNWIILRPSIIVGPGDHLRPMLAKMIKLLPAVPVIGDGKYMTQPVGVNDLTEGIIKLLDNSGAECRIFEIGGPEKITFDQMIDLIGRAMGKKRVRKIHQPVSIIRAAAGLLGRFSWFPVTPDQITMLLIDNVTDDTGFFELSGIVPTKTSDLFSRAFG